MNESHRKNLVKVILIASIGIFLSSALAWAETPKIEDRLRTPALNPRRAFNLAPLNINTINQLGSTFLGTASIRFRNLTPPGINISSYSFPKRSSIQSINSGIHISRINPSSRISYSGASVRFNLRPAIATTPQIRGAAGVALRIHTSNPQVATVALGRNNIATPPRISSMGTSSGVNLQHTITTAPQIRTTTAVTGRINAPTLRMPTMNLAGTNPIRNTSRAVNTGLQPVRLQPARLQPARLQPARLQPARLQPARVNPAPRTSPLAVSSSFNTRLNTSAMPRISAPVATTPRIINTPAPARPAAVNLERRNIRENNRNRIPTPPAIPSGSSRIRQLQSINTRFKAPTIISSARGLNLSPRQPLYARFPKSGSALPLSPSRQREPAGLPEGPVVPNSSPSQTSGSSGGGGGSNNHASSRNHSSGSGFPLTAPLMLGLCGYLPSSFKKSISRMISEISRRQKNGIGFILAPRAPNINQVDECSLAFVHQTVKEENPTPHSRPYTHLILRNYILNQKFNRSVKPIFTPRPFILEEGLGIKDSFLRSQAHCGLFYFLKRKDGR